MIEKGNIYDIGLYRETRSRRGSDELDPGRRLSIHTDGGVAELIRGEAADSGDDISTVFHEALVVGIGHRRMMRDGWRGPHYRRSRVVHGMARRLLGILGVSVGDEVVKLSVTRPDLPSAQLVDIIEQP